jgi:type VI secretion system (T6SS) baseplate-like injector VgrG
MRRFFGKHRGKVTNNVDPESRGRIQVSVPAVLGAGRLSWAMPSVPVAGIQSGFYAVPPMNANVWVEFEGGNPDHPIWTGCFWGVGETPSAALVPPSPTPHILLQTTAQNTIHINDGGPLLGILLQSGASTIQIGPQGIKITAPKIEINGMTIINNGNLTVAI